MSAIGRKQTFGLSLNQGFDARYAVGENFPVGEPGETTYCREDAAGSILAVDGQRQLRTVLL